MSKIEADKMDGQALENQTRRIGLQAMLSEKVVDAKEDHSCQQTALKERFAATGEPSEAPKG
jgi:hypothetical protein